MNYLGRGGFMGRMNYLPRSARQRCIIDGMTVGTIVLGALFSISNSKMFSGLFTGGEQERGANR